MLEIKLLSLLIGSLGLQAIAISGWLRSQQLAEDWQFEEEETLTPYESKETVSGAGQQTNGAAATGASGSTKETRVAGWEFKIVRADSDLFRHPAVFKRLCDEEAQAGWILLEKLDDRRVRFKRSISVRQISKPELLSFDPYRTHYGATSHWKTVLGAIAFLSVMLLPAYLGYMLVANTLQGDRAPAGNRAPTPNPSPPSSAPTVPAAASPVPPTIAPSPPVAPVPSVAPSPAVPPTP